MKDEVELPTSVHVEDVEKVFVKKVKRLGNTGYVSVHRRYIGKDIIVILPKDKEIKAKKIVKV
jgi:putative transposon-encoded protein